MKGLTALAPFLSVVAAIDAYLYITPDCRVTGPGGGFGSYMRCNNMRPNTCCGVDTTESPFQSIALQGIQDGFPAFLIGYRGGNCTERVARDSGHGSFKVCIPYFGISYTGCDWNPGFYKRDSLDEKVGCQRPDVLVLPDGTEYELSGLSNESFQEILDISALATGSSDIPDKFRVL